MIDLGTLMDEAQDEAWHIDPRDDDPRDELARQSAFLRDARLLCPKVFLMAVPNAAKRSQWAAGKAKREGMVTGALDLIATWPGGGIAFIEFKGAKSQPTPAQRDILNRYIRQGHHAGVFRQERSALAWLRDCGAPFSTRGPL